MSRCIVCDYCSEIDGIDGRAYTWSDEDVGYTCSKCRESIINAVFYNVNQELGGWSRGDPFKIAEVLEAGDLEGPEVLEIPNLESNPEQT